MFSADNNMSGVNFVKNGLFNVFLIITQNNRIWASSNCKRLLSSWCKGAEKARDIRTGGRRAGKGLRSSKNSLTRAVSLSEYKSIR